MIFLNHGSILLHLITIQLLVTIVASWGYFCLGGIRGWSSPGLPSLRKTIYDPTNTPNSSDYFQMSEEDLTWICKLLIYNYFIFIKLKLLLFFLIISVTSTTLRHFREFDDHRPNALLG